MKPTADTNVTTMETRFAYFFAEHNIPFAVADHLSKLVRGMMAEAVKCPEVATKFGCERTKTTRIIKSAIAPVPDSNVMSLCTERATYSLMIDESNDRIPVPVDVRHTRSNLPSTFREKQQCSVRLFWQEGYVCTCQCFLPTK